MNALVVEALLMKEDPGRDASLATCESQAQQRFNETRSVWDAVTIADVALVRAFLRHCLPQERDNLVEKYRSAFAESSATSREQDSVLTHMEFVRNILGKLPSPDRAMVASAIESLDYIHAQLRPREQAVEPAVGDAKRKDHSSRSTRVSVQQPARKNPVQEKKTRRPTRRGKGKV
jgi:hypothetical protein